jgi:AraC-like DNA-binding protein
MVWSLKKEAKVKRLRLADETCGMSAEMSSGILPGLASASAEIYRRGGHFGGACRFPEKFGRLESMRPGLDLFLAEATALEDLADYFFYRGSALCLTTVVGGETEADFYPGSADGRHGHLFSPAAGPSESVYWINDLGGRIILPRGRSLQSVTIIIRREFLERHVSRLLDDGGTGGEPDGVGARRGADMPPGPRKPGRTFCVPFSLAGSRGGDVFADDGGGVGRGGGDNSGGASPLSLCSRKRLSAQKRQIAVQMLGCHFPDSCQKLFLEGKALEMTALYLSQMVVPRRERLFFSENDLDKLRLARRMLIRDVVSPPSLKILSRHCGLNENKVKSGFREYFGETFSDILRRERMRQARHLVAKSEKQVGLVANLVGYSNTSHFIAAFRAEFGLTPGQLRRQARDGVSRPAEEE